MHMVGGDDLLDPEYPNSTTIFLLGWFEGRIALEHSTVFLANLIGWIEVFESS